MHSYPCVAKNVIPIKIPCPLHLDIGIQITYKLLLPYKIGFVLQKLLCICSPTFQTLTGHIVHKIGFSISVIKTYFIVNRKHPIQVGLTSPASPRDKTDGESAESVKIAMEDKEDTQVRITALYTGVNW